MTSRLYTFIIFCVAVLTASGAETARSVLQHAVDKMKSGAVEANFTVVAPGLNGDGHLVLNGNKFVVETDDLSTWYDGKTQWTLSKGVNEVTVTTPTMEELAEVNPMLVLSGLSSKFNAEMGNAKAGTYEIVLVSKLRDSQISSARVIVDSNTWYAKSMDIITGSGQKFTIKIKDIKNIKTPLESVFKFNPKAYKGVEVIDLR